MKNRIIKTICILAFAATTLPILANDYLKIYFKDGHTERHYMKLVESISATKYDLDGVLHSDYQMQQIVMKDITYSYYLADIDSMSFTKVDEEQLQKKVTAVANTIEPIFNQCESIEDMEQHLDEIKNIDGVENVYSTGTDIVVQVKDWYNIVYNYFLRQEAPLVTNNANELASRLKKKVNPVYSANTAKPKVAIAFQMVDDLSKEWQLNLLIDLKENFERKGFEVTIIADEEKGDEKLDAYFYLTRMFDYDMVLLYTHGLSLGGKHALYTGENASTFWGTFLTIENHTNPFVDLDEYGIAGCHVGTERLSDGTYKEEVKYYWYVSEDLIKKSSAKFKDPGTHIVFIGACEQLKGKEKSVTFDDGQTESYSDSFAQVLFDKGADFVAGYTKKALRSCNASNNFYRNLLNGFSLEASLSYLPEIQKNEITIVSDEKAKGARLIGLLNPNVNNLRDYFLFKTKTEQISEQELAETYKSGNVVVSGTATAEYPITIGGNPMESSQLVTDNEKKKGHEGTPKKLRCGFRHGLDPNLSKDYQEVYSEKPDIEENTIDNVHFSCNIALPTACETYYYQAFTYDGLNYNLGNICHFDATEVSAPVCPARITNVEFLGAEYHHSAERQNQMPYTVTAVIDDMTDIEEWGICYYGTTISEFPFTSVSNEQSKKLTYSTASSNLGKTTTKLKVDFNAYVAELNDEVGIYVKKRDKATGELTTIYGEKFPFTLRYDTKPSLIYSNPTIRETKVIATKNGHKQYQTIVDYNYSAKGTFWMEYCSYIVVGNNWNDAGSSKLYFEKDADGQLNSTEKYWDNIKLGHSAYDVIYLRNSKKTYSNCLNFSGSNGYIDNVWVSSSPAYSARQKESNSGDSEYMNYRIVNIPTEDVNAKQKKVIHQIPYGGGCLEEIAY